MKADQIFAEIIEVFESTVEITNASLPKELKTAGGKSHKDNGDEVCRKWVHVSGDLDKMEQTETAAAAKKREKARRVAIYTEQAVTETITAVDIDEIGQYQAELRFASILIKSGILTEEDFEE